MSWVAVAIGGGALVGAAGSYLSADKANKPKSSKTDQKTVQGPYMEGDLAPHLQGILGDQAALYQGGKAGGAAPAPSTAPTGTQMNNPNAVYIRPSGEEFWLGKNQGKPRPSGPTIDAKTGREIGGGAGGGAAPGPAGPPSYTSPDQIYREIADRSLNREPGALLTGAKDKLGRVIGSEGFEGYNPILDDLTGRLGGASLDRGSSLLEQFLSETNRGSGQGGRPQPGQKEGGSWGGGGSSYQPGVGTTIRSGGDPYAVQGGGGRPVDTMAQGGYFSEEVRKLMDDEMAREEIEKYMAAISEDALKGHFKQLADLDARAMGSGRFQGTDHGFERLAAREEFDEGLQQVGAKLSLEDLLSRRNLKESLLGQVNARDLAAMGDKTQRYGIDTAASTARAGIGQGAADAASARELQERLGLRSQDLSAIGMMMQGDQFGLGLLGELGGQRSGDLFSGLGMAPGMEYADMAPLEYAMGAGGGLAGLELGRGQIQAGKAGVNLQRQMYEDGQAQQQLNDYLRTVLAIGGLGGTQTTQGTNVVPGANISTGGAALLGGLGGAATGAGLYGQYRGYG